MPELNGKVAIVTGGARGIGQAYCVGFARAGAVVAVADILDTGDTVAKIEDSGGQALGLNVDVSKMENVKQMADRVIERFKKIDILVNNAAMLTNLTRGPMTEIPEDEWDQTFAVNVKGMWHCTKAVLPHMTRQKYGKIINISSSTIHEGAPGFLHYVASKGAVFSMTRAMSRELGPYGIRVNTITPGLTQSDGIKLMRQANPQLSELVKLNASLNALHSEEVPEDLVGTAVFLASPGSDFITGQLINVDGGLSHH